MKKTKAKKHKSPKKMKKLFHLFFCFLDSFFFVVAFLFACFLHSYYLEKNIRDSLSCFLKNSAFTSWVDRPTTSNKIAFATPATLGVWPPNASASAQTATRTALDLESLHSSCQRTALSGSTQTVVRTLVGVRVNR